MPDGETYVCNTTYEVSAESAEKAFKTILDLTQLKDGIKLTGLRANRKRVRPEDQYGEEPF